MYTRILKRLNTTRRYTSTLTKFDPVKTHFLRLLASYQNKKQNELHALLNQKITSLKLNHHLEELDEVEAVTEIRAIRKTLNPTFSVIASTNRGVIAMQTFETAKKLGFETVMVCHEEDKRSFPASLFDHVLIVSDPNNINETINVIHDFQSTLPPNYSLAVHPGYGFLSEKSEFSGECERNGIIFIGPIEKAMQAFGNKAQARITAQTLNVPVVPGYNGENQDRLFLLQKGIEINFPIMLKTTDGGGGTGNFVAYDEQELKTILFSLKESTEVILEKFISEPRHIELQFFLSKNKNGEGEIICTGSRDCSLQRRYQKIIEIAPAQSDMLPEMTAYSRTLLSKAIELGYQGAITVEWLEKNGVIYLNECNTRAQVEHLPSDDRIPGFSTLEAQIYIASGRPIKDYLITAFNLDPDDTRTAQEIVDHHLAHSTIPVSIEARINAVELISYDGALLDSPTRGTVTDFSIPAGSESKIKSIVPIGEKINAANVNPLIMLVRGHGQTTQAAADDLRSQLSQIVIEGIDTNLSYQIHAIDSLTALTSPPHVETCKAIDKAYIEKMAAETSNANQSSFRIVCGYE